MVESEHMVFAQNDSRPCSQHGGRLDFSPVDETDGARLRYQSDVTIRVFKYAVLVEDAASYQLDVLRNVCLRRPNPEQITQL